MKKLYIIVILLLTTAVGYPQPFQYLCQKNFTSYKIQARDSLFQIAIVGDTIAPISSIFKNKATVKVSYCNSPMNLIIAFQYTRLYVTLPYDADFRSRTLIIQNGELVSKDVEKSSFNTNSRSKF